MPGLNEGRIFLKYMPNEVPKSEIFKRLDTFVLKLPLLHLSNTICLYFIPLSLFFFANFSPFTNTCS